MRSHPPWPLSDEFGSGYIILQHYKLHIVCKNREAFTGGFYETRAAMIVNLLLDLLDLKGWLIFVCVLLIVVDVIRNKDPPNFPPGPWPLPVVGNIFTGQDFKSQEKVSDKM